MEGPTQQPSWPDSFSQRHLGPNAQDQMKMLHCLRLNSLDELLEKALPTSIRLNAELDLPLKGLSEADFLTKARSIANKNQVFKSYLGQGYYDTHLPSVILRNILENPSWYTAYTPYQAEISQGRMEALLNFQTMVADLTGLPVANSSLLDEGTAAAEAMTMCRSINKASKSQTLIVDQDIFPQTLEVLQTRAEPLGIEIKPVNLATWDFSIPAFAIYGQYPTFSGQIFDFTEISAKAHKQNTLVILGTDLLALTLLKTPGEMGADVALGSSQRFGVPLNFGGPHAAFIATKAEYIRSLPGRIVGLSKDVDGKPALRLTLQTREQHIRREKATSNICTAQVLLAVIASMYAVYHGPEGLIQIATRTHRIARAAAKGLTQLGFKILHSQFFDTIRVAVTTAQQKLIVQRAQERGLNLAPIGDDVIGISFDETKSLEDLDQLLSLFADREMKEALDLMSLDSQEKINKDLGPLKRQSSFLNHPTFKSYHSETEMLRYIHRLESKDLTLANAMIPLGSCTMKLNATSEMIPITWPELGQIHPFAPLDQVQGYLHIFKELEHWLCQLTGFAAVSFQPNAGSQGEFAGLLVIRRYFQSRGESHRNICLIPRSAHGTNPASAVMAGFQVVVLACDDQGNIDLNDLKAKVETHREHLAALMVTYPSTHGVFEEEIRHICEVVHSQGGQVYMDGANFNAMVGISRPQDVGADVCHLNLHKTFCIPHGGGGPGVGPIAVAKHLQSFLPTHHMRPECGPKNGISAVSSAPWGSAAILPISWSYVQMMGLKGLREATQVSILSANYIAQRLQDYYPVVFRGKNGFVAHECILNCNGFRESAGIQVEDIAKRLIDFGFHAPTMSWPVPGTLMVEPTESESLAEIDRFCEAMIQIREEIRAIEKGDMDRDNNVLRHSPHSLEHLTTQEWNHPYSREEATFPLPWVREHKFWTTVRRVDNAYGDRNLVCSCPDPNDL